MEDDWWATIVSQLNATVEPTPVPIPIFDVRRAREAQKVFRDLHVKAWRKNGYPPVASQFDVPPVVARVLRSFHGHRPAPTEEGYNDHQAVSRSPALQGILNVRKDRDERTRKALQKAAKQKGQATLSSFVAPKPRPVEEPLPDLHDLDEDDAEAKSKGDYETAGLSLGERAELPPTSKWMRHTEVKWSDLPFASLTCEEDIEWWQKRCGGKERNVRAVMGFPAAIVNESYLKYGKTNGITKERWVRLHAMLKLDVPWDALSFVVNDERCSTVLHNEIDEDINFLCSIMDDVRESDLYDPCPLLLPPM